MFPYNPSKSAYESGGAIRTQELLDLNDTFDASQAIKDICVNVKTVPSS